ncbi:S-layer homology domain-containing protein [Chitinophaga nivalis]|uniref:S-layer homology domain-containing protein n=1 Tax=Chitinophaga nivalis TaxID=2991709 RepID=A0ABT3IK33_9BACT|nr:S-layer homology domain-containing protein [Chitinophaga nivalis]MCW3465996.1 S-layer homology domain-containing protein [Chitinophaga nivalis]MCW3484313.1 S-layer homology domain-containing protein [Chitinophaga nivalis]
MNLRTALALPAFILVLQPGNIYSKEKYSDARLPLVIVESRNGTGQAAAPKKKVSVARGIELIVKGLDLNINNIRFIKAPKATDYYVYANNKASYAPSLIIAANNGIQLERTVRLEKPLTREQFAQHLDEAILSTGDYVTNAMWLTIGDEAKFSQKALTAVQQLIKFNVVKLEKGNFRPKAFITEAEATEMIKRAAEFVQSPKEGKE